MNDKYNSADDETVMKAAKEASVKYKKALDQLSEFDISNNDRCINCGHYYSPDELIEVVEPIDGVYICYYCSSDGENLNENKTTEEE